MLAGIVEQIVVNVPQTAICLRHVINQLRAKCNLDSVNGREQYLSQSIVELIPLDDILEVASAVENVVHRVSLHVPPIGLQSEVADTFQTTDGEVLVAKQHAATLQQINLLLYGSRCLVSHIQRNDPPAVLMVCTTGTVIVRRTKCPILSVCVAKISLFSESCKFF